METQRIEWENNGTLNLLKVRNVGNEYPSAQVQMVFERFNPRTERNMPLVCIDIPAEKVEEFLNALKE